MILNHIAIIDVLGAFANMILSDLVGCGNIFMDELAVADVFIVVLLLSDVLLLLSDVLLLLSVAEKIYLQHSTIFHPHFLNKFDELLIK